MVAYECFGTSVPLELSFKCLTVLWLDAESWTCGFPPPLIVTVGRYGNACQLPKRSEARPVVAIKPRSNSQRN